MALEDIGVATSWLSQYSPGVSASQVGMDRVTDNAVEFSRQLTKLANYTESAVNAVIRKTCLDLFTSIVKRTPADTGRARGSWMISGMGNTGKKLPDTYKSFGSQTSRGMEKVRETIGEFMLERIGDTIVIHNNVEYIEPLENGHSQQAPAGMVAVSLQEFNQFMQENSKILKRL